MGFLPRPYGEIAFRLNIEDTLKLLFKAQ